MMKQYTTPILEIYALEQTDVIRTSGVGGESEAPKEFWTKFY